MYATNYTANHVYIYNFNADVLSWGVCLFVVVCLMVVCCVVVVVVVVFWGFFVVVVFWGVFWVFCLFSCGFCLRCDWGSVH